MTLDRLGNWYVRRAMGPANGWREEPDLERCQQMAQPYVGRCGQAFIRYNVAKMVDFARRGAAGVINAVGENCMVGVVSAAVTQRIRHDHGGIPVVTLSYGVSETDALRTSLEAFVHQVQRWPGQKWAQEPAISDVVC